MAQMDEFKKEREAIKTAPLKKRLEYFWDYYKWHTIITIIAICAITGYIYQVATAKESILNGALLNSFTESDVVSTMIEEYADQENIDLSKYDVVLNTSLSYGNSYTSVESKQVIITQTAAGMIDFFTGDVSSMQDLAYSFMLLDLRDVLTTEQLEKYEPYFLYIDEAVLNALEAASDNFDDNIDIKYPDCRNPETMDNPIPILIDVSRCDDLKTAYNNIVPELMFGISSSVTNTDQTLAFLDYLME